MNEEKGFLAQLLAAIKSNPVVGKLFERQESAAAPYQKGQSVEIAPFEAAGTSKGLPYVPVAFLSDPTSEGTRTEVFGAVKRPEGVRFYSGQSRNIDPTMAEALAQMSMEQKMRSAPADSIPIRAAYQRLVGNPESMDETGQMILLQALRTLKTNPEYLYENKY